MNLQLESFEPLKNLVDMVPNNYALVFNFEPEYFECQCWADDIISLFQVKFSKNDLLCYELASSFSTRVDIKKLRGILQCLDYNDILNIKANDKHLCFEMKNPKSLVSFTFNILIVSAERLCFVPELEYNSTVTMDIRLYNDIYSMFLIFSSKNSRLNLYTREKTFSLELKGDVRDTCVTLSNSTESPRVKIDVRQETMVTIDPCKLMPLGEFFLERTIQIIIEKDWPVCFLLCFGTSSCIKHFVSPLVVDPVP